MSKRKAPEPEIFYVKEILKKRKRKGRVEMLVSWVDYTEDDNTWEPVKHLPPEMVAAFNNRRKKTKLTEEADDSHPEMVVSATEEDTRRQKKTTDATSLQDKLVEEISKREENSKQFSKKARTKIGQFDKKDTNDFSWRNYVQDFFKQHPGFEMQCCGKKYDIAQSYITHRYRHHIKKIR